MLYIGHIGELNGYNDKGRYYTVGVGVGGGRSHTNNTLNQIIRRLQYINKIINVLQKYWFYLSCELNVTKVLEQCRVIAMLA